jgi:hypothetical protein
VKTSDRAILAFVLVAIVAALVVLTLAGRETTLLVGLCGPAVSGLFGLLLLQRAQANGSKIDTVAADTKLVVQATNGVTTGRFDSVDAQLGRAHVDRAANAAADRIDDQDARDDRATTPGPTT